MKTPKVAVILAGSGVYDGSEIHEATMTLYAILKQGGTYDIFAPNINQHHVINHITGAVMEETRNVLVESARIARGQIKDITQLAASDFDALIIPGGFGVAKNLSDFAFKGSESIVLSSVSDVIKAFVDQQKPIGALCISPAILANVLEGATVTIGQDEGIANAIKDMGGHHEITNHGEVVIDKKYKLATTPCYMLDATIIDIADGAVNVVGAVFEMI
ncbi:MAG: isoprenoid biosynthesis glyoxalase ElbB [Bacteroidales bacterium]|nr:isoprenoid biosynthesis glyoxalase ElbB [Bacteroidales bacterium]